MTVSKVVAKRKKTGAKAEAEYDFGANLAETTKIFGETTIYNHVVGALKVAFQGWLRSQMDQKKTQAEITAAAKNWKPGQRKQAKSPQEKLREQLTKLSPEERANILKEYTASAKGAGVAGKTA